MNRADFEHGVFSSFLPAKLFKDVCNTVISGESMLIAFADPSM